MMKPRGMNYSSLAASKGEIRTHMIEQMWPRGLKGRDHLEYLTADGSIKLS
jgi:hypothetical protein